LRYSRKFSMLIPPSILLAWLIFFRPPFLYGDTSYLIIMGSSMEPALKQGDLVLLKRVDNYSVGDILGYVNPYGPTVIHRIVATEEGAFSLKGDNRNTIDPWLVTKEMVLGKLMFSIPYVGHMFNFLKEPIRLAATIAFLFFVSAIPFSEQAKKRKHKLHISRGWISKRIISIVLIAVLFAVSAYGIFYTHGLPSERTKFVELYKCEHVGNFDYTVELKPNTLYNKTTIAPGEAIYLNLARAMDIRFEYVFNCTQKADVHGNYTVHMNLELPGEWIRRSTLVSEVPFAQEGFTFTNQVNITQTGELISKIEDETGMRASSYNLNITVEIQVESKVMEDLVLEEFGPSMVMIFTRNRLAVEGLSCTKPKIVGRTEIEALQWNMYLRYFSYAALVGSSGVVVWVAYYQRWKPRTMAEMTRKYKNLIVESEPLAESHQKIIIKVKSLEDITKVSQETLKPVMHETIIIKEGKARRHTFYVVDVDVKYELVVEELTESST